jgi:hypothetical protein
MGSFHGYQGLRRFFMVYFGRLFLAVVLVVQVQSLLPAKNSELGTGLDVSDLKPTLSQTFAAMPKLRLGPNVDSPPKPLDDPAFEWTAAGHYASPSPSGLPGRTAILKEPAMSWHPTEGAAFPNGDFIAITRYSPFSIKDDKLAITIDRITPEIKPYVPEAVKAEYISGALTSYPFAQRYGYFEARMKLSAGKGLWPAFWLLPSDGSWPPEFDVMEMLGDNVKKYYATIHSNVGGNHTVLPGTIDTVDLTGDFHRYGMDWGPETIRFYLDGKLVAEQPTPADAHQPFYLIVQLALGSAASWPGAPDDKTPFPSSIEVDYIKVWQRARYETSQ